MFELNAAKEATPKRSLIERSVYMMFKIMIEMEEGRGQMHEMVAAILDTMCDTPIALSRYMGGSIVVANTQWKDLTPQRAIVGALVDRLERVIDEYNSGIITEYASPGEVLCFVHGASQAGPLQSEYAELAAWCFYQCSKKYGWGDTSILEMFDHSGINFDANRIYNERDRLSDAFRVVARQVRRQVVQSGKAKGIGNRFRTDEEEADTDSAPPASATVPDVIATQLQFF